MKSIQKTISIHFVNELISALDDSNVDVEFLLSKSGINPRLLASRLSRVTPRQFSRFILSIWRTMDDEFMGMSNKKARFGLFMLMAKHAVYLPDLGSFFRYLSDFYLLTGSAMKLELQESDEWVRLTLKTNKSAHYSGYTLDEFYLMVWHRFGSWLVGKPINLKAVEFAFSEQRHSSEYQLMYPCSVGFNKTFNALVFKRSQLSLPIVQDEGSLDQYLRRLPYDWFTKQAYQQTFTKKTYDYLVRVGFANASIELLAKELYLTSRTLRRKLADEKSSFQAIKDRVRLDQAITLLGQQNLSIQNISIKLGFSDAPSFSRAFKNWTGVSPHTFRAKS